MNGIYIIENTINNKCYIGSSTQLNKRLTTHKCLLNKNQHHSYKLQGAFNKYGESNFNFRILEEVQFPEEYTKLLKLEYLECLEQHYINKYNSYKKGYNVSKIPKIVGNSNTKDSIKKGIQTRRERGSYNISELTRKKRSESLKNNEYFKQQHMLGAVKRRKMIYQYDLEGNFIKECGSCQDIAKELNVCMSMIRKMLSGEKCRCKTFIFSYEKADKIESFKERKSKLLPKLSRYIKMYDVYDNLLKIYSNYKECAKDLKLKEDTISSYMTKFPKGLNYRLEYGSAHK